MTKRIVKWSKYFGRSGYLSGTYIFDDVEWRLWKFLEEHEIKIWLYEVLGKHSEVSVLIHPDNYSVLVEDDQPFVEKAAKVFGTTHGFDIMSHVDYDSMDQEDYDLLMLGDPDSVKQA